MNRLSPFYRFLFFILIVLSVFFADGIMANAIILAVVLFSILCSDVKVKDLISPLYKLRYFLLFIFFLNMLFSNEGTLFSLSIFRISKEGILNAFLIVYRVSLITLIAYLYTSGSTINEINDSLYIVLCPLKLLFIPVDTLSSAISISLSLIDEFISESEHLRKVRRLRRMGRDEGFKEKILSYKSIVIPIFLMAFKRADELSLSLESRGYSAQMRVKREYLKIGIKEFSALFFSFTFLVLTVTGGIK